MSKAFDDIMAGLNDALAYAQGDTKRGKAYSVRTAPEVDCKAIRTRLGLSQAEFARRYGLRLATLQDWERGKRKPDTAARLLYRVIEREPEAVERALADFSQEETNDELAGSNQP